MAEHESSYRSLIVIVTWVQAGLGLAVFGARTYTCWRYTRRFRLDYFLSLATIILACLAQAFLTVAAHWGLGNHITTFKSPKNIVNALETTWVAQILAIAGVVIGKLSIIAFLDQVRGHQKSKPWLLWFIGLSNIIVNAIVILLILIQCEPVEKLWNDNLPGNCNRRGINQRYAYFQGSWSAVSDLALALYPSTIIWKLQMKLRVKIGLCFLLGFGVLAAVCSAIKTAQLSTLSRSDDITFFIARLALTTVTEQWIILIVGCVPPLRPLIRAIFHQATGSTNKSTGAAYTGPYGGSTYAKGTVVSTKRVSTTPARNGNLSRAYRTGSPPDDGFELRENTSQETIFKKDAKGIMMTREINVYHTDVERSGSGSSAEGAVGSRPI